MAEDEGNPTDKDAPSSARRPAPAPPPLEEPPAVDPAKEESRLSKQVPIGVLFAAAAAVILVFLALVGTIAYFALSPKK